MRRVRKIENDDLLNGWKEIANHLKCSRKTAHRWAKTDDLPVLQPVSRSKAPVFASKRALNVWLRRGIEHALITETQLIALDRRNRILWAHDFSMPLRSYSSDELSWRLQIVDLSGKGERGLLLAARFRALSIPDTLYYFSLEGDIEWQLEADPPIRDRTDRPFDRAWVFKHVAVTRSPSGCLVWASMGNDAGWAGCVLRIDSRGSASVHFANAGYIEWLSPVTLPTGDFIIACGENNDFDQSMVALLGTEDPPSRSILGERLVYRFANSPTGSPRKYILFPRTELISARAKPYGHATRIVQHLDGVIVEVETGEEGANFRYHFSRELEPRYVFPSGSHEFVHQLLEKTGSLAHAWRDCPELQSSLVLRIWEPDSGWYDQPIPWRDNPWKEIEGAKS